MSVIPADPAPVVSLDRTTKSEMISLAMTNAANNAPRWPPAPSSRAMASASTATTRRFFKAPIRNPAPTQHAERIAAGNRSIAQAREPLRPCTTTNRPKRFGTARTSSFCALLRSGRLRPPRTSAGTPLSQGKNSCANRSRTRQGIVVQRCGPRGPWCVSRTHVERKRRRARNQGGGAHQPRRRAPCVVGDRRREACRRGEPLQYRQAAGHRSRAPLLDRNACRAGSSGEEGAKDFA